jgi:hypothetical protein
VQQRQHLTLHVTRRSGRDLRLSEITPARPAQAVITALMPSMAFLPSPTIISHHNTPSVT